MISETDILKTFQHLVKRSDADKSIIIGSGDDAAVINIKDKCLVHSVDISKIDNCTVGDWVVLWGDNISINKFAETNSLISYELMTKISPRVKKTFVEL